MAHTETFFCRGAWGRSARTTQTKGTLAQAGPDLGNTSLGSSQFILRGLTSSASAQLNLNRKASQHEQIKTGSDYYTRVWRHMEAAGKKAC